MLAVTDVDASLSFYRDKVGFVLDHDIEPGNGVPNLWFGAADGQELPRQRFHVEVYVAPEVAAQRIAAAVGAGGTVLDDSEAPALTVIADQDGNAGVVCVDASAAKKD